jgi:hypothetical protein
MLLYNGIYNCGFKHKHIHILNIIFESKYVSYYKKWSIDHIDMIYWYININDILCLWKYITNINFYNNNNNTWCQMPQN